MKVRWTSLLLLAAFLATNAWAQSAKAATAAPAAGDERLVSAEWLSAQLKDPKLVLLYVGPKTEFDKEHIAGSQFVTLQDISTPQDMTGNTLSLELPSVEQLKGVFEKRGISNDSRIVVYYGQDLLSPSTRVIWTLNYLGLGERTSLMDGGVSAWKAAGNAV